ncbi:MAG TPA: trypsin-like peptidase domain-containing protein [Planctomycetota bacterium]|nr:trypsin-like peptidase domain-containing protein [Planctomycetota bacterium]
MNAVFLLFALSHPLGQAESTLECIEREVSAVVEKARPSVVQVIGKAAGDGFQNIAEPAETKSSGFIVSADGAILTDVGGIRTARQIFVLFHDGRRLEATVAGVDFTTAIALLRVNAGGLKPVVFAEPGAIRQGAIAILISNPAGLTHSSSVGFVSGVERSISVGGVRYDDMLQTSAAVQSGDGGGLLANSRGLAVGMIHSRYVPDGLNPDPTGFLRPVPRNGFDFLPAGGPSIGFATPASTLRFVAERLMKHGRVTRGWAGVAMRRATQYSIVTEVCKEGPAWKAGLRKDDKVLEFDGEPAVNLSTIRRKVIETVGSKPVKVRVLRAGAAVDLDLTIETEPGP